MFQLPSRALAWSFASLILLATPLAAQRRSTADSLAAKRAAAKALGVRLPAAKPPAAASSARLPAAIQPSAQAPPVKPVPRTIAAQLRDPVLRKQELRSDDGHRLILWEKRPSARPKGEILLLHGRTWSALPNFDLNVPGQRVSLMNALVAEGYTVYALDQRGYGATKRDTTGWLTPNRAADDVAAVTDWIAAHAPTFRRPTVLGYSRGSATAMLAAQNYPARMAALIMYAPYYSITNRPAAVVDPRVPPMAHTTDTSAAEDFISPDSTPAGVKAAYVKAATLSDPIRVDWRREAQFDVLDPAKLRVPVMIIQGERDPYAKDAALPEFFAKLAATDKWWVVLAGADHVAHLERQSAFVAALTSFLERGGAR